MSLRLRILRVLETGPRKRTVLRGLARTRRQEEGFDDLLARMREDGEIVMRGSKRGSRYALPIGRKR